MKDLRMHFKQNRFVFILYTAIFLFAGCNDTTNRKISEPVEKPEAVAAPAAESVYSEQLVDLGGSRNIKDVLCQGWELRDDIDAISGNHSSMGLLPFRSFYLAADYTFIKNPRNAMDYGRWSYNDAAKTFTLRYHNGGKDTYKIGAIKSTELIVINSGIGSITLLTFVSKGNRYNGMLQDPYHIANNQWRIAPNRPESDSLIRKRLKGFLHFYILFYRDNITRNNKVISFYGLPTCLEWYSGGIAMVKEAELADNWFGCFYNKEQALRAYKMMVQVIKKKYQWPERKEGWVKRNLAILEQMYKNI